MLGRPASAGGPLVAARRGARLGVDASRLEDHDGRKPRLLSRLGPVEARQKKKTPLFSSRGNENVS